MKKVNKSGAGKTKTKQRFPPGWDEKRVQEVITYYENQTEDEQLAEHEAGLRAQGQATMTVPAELVPVIRHLIARLRRGA